MYLQQTFQFIDITAHFGRGLITADPLESCAHRIDRACRVTKLPDRILKCLSISLKVIQPSLILVFLISPDHDQKKDTKQQQDHHDKYNKKSENLLF